MISYKTCSTDAKLSEGYRKEKKVWMAWRGEDGRHLHLAKYGQRKPKLFLSFSLLNTLEISDQSKLYRRSTPYFVQERSFLIVYSISFLLPLFLFEKMRYAIR